MQWINPGKASLLVVGVLLAQFSLSGCLAAADNPARTVIIQRAGDDVEATVADPVNEDVIFLSARTAWLGVRLVEVTAEKVSELKLKEESGALVTEVEPGSPAAKAGLKADDVIVEYQGERVESAAQLRRLVHETPTGRSVRLSVIRNGQRQTLTAKLEQRAGVRREIRVPPIRVPEIHIPPIRVPDFDVEVFGAGPRLGILADALTPQLADYFGVKQGKGVLVTEVREGSPAARGGLKAGDVIVRLDDQAVENVRELRRALRGKKDGETVTLLVVRQRAEQTLKVQLEEERRAEGPLASRYFDSEAFLREYRASMENLKQQMQALRQNLQRELGEKQRNLQRELLRLRQEIREHLSL